MRVISGEVRGRKLKTQEGLSARPTTDRIKESIFNIIQFDIEGRSVLDLFAGSGQLGIEALSRGAERAVFVDNSREACEVIGENLETTGFSLKSKVVQTGFAPFLDACRERFDLVFLDAPYLSKEHEKALELIFKIDILNPNGIIICETGRDIGVPEGDGPYAKLRDYLYGGTRITKYQRTV